jgi:hypothetical protein
VIGADSQPLAAFRALVSASDASPRSALMAVASNAIAEGRELGRRLVITASRLLSRLM